jgi:FkbM family methyltransferase
MSQKYPERIAFCVRGPVDQDILHEVLTADGYGVRDLAAAWSGDDATTATERTIVDIGAHIGAFAVLAATLWPGCRLIACECDPDNLALLKQNLLGAGKETRRLGDKETLANVRIVEAAIVGEEVAEVEFHAVTDKAGRNSGGGSCFLREPGSQAMRVPALSIRKLWREQRIERCDLLKLDCEGAELPILAALAGAGLLPRIRCLVGEWHVLPEHGQTPASVMHNLHSILAATQQVEIGRRAGVGLGYFRAMLK